MSELPGEISRRNGFDSLEQEAHLSLLRTCELLTAEFAALFKPLKITAAQYSVLRILRGHGAQVATRRIAEQLVTREPDVTRLLDRLERAGLIARRRCAEDRRIVWVTITPAGLELLRKLDRPVLELHRSQLAHLGERKLRTLIRLLSEAREPSPDR